MSEVCKHIEISDYTINRYDPTHTTVLRNEMVRESNRRFNMLTKLIKKMVVEKDVFGLKERIHTLQELPEKAFEFLIDARKIEKFTYWLEEQIKKGLLDGWPNKYLTDAYKRGILRSLEEMRKTKKYSKTLSIVDIGGEKVIFTLSPHINTMELLYLRSYSELKGITLQMEQQIARILAQGFIRGDTPEKLARKLVAAINGKGIGELGITDTLGRFIPAQRRAEMLARTEIIRAYAEASLSEYERWGVTGVIVMAEVRTARDDRVCSFCGTMEGKVYTIAEARGMIPFHVLCRCAWVISIK
jgi:SPP1 gp7 family putative phage head morphogenesis protein